MNKLAQVSQAMQKVLNEASEQAGVISGFLQRQSKLRPALFVKILVFGFLSKPQASLHYLTRVAAILGVKISPQGLDDRFSESAADCLKRVLAVALEQVIASQPVVIELLQRFKQVQLIDTTIISLPKALAQWWRGCGGSLGTTAALKLEVAWDLLTGLLIGPYLYDGHYHDTYGRAYRSKLPAGSLRLMDLGYFSLQKLQDFTLEGIYWLMRVKISTGIVDKSGRSWRLDELLRARKSDRLEEEIKLGMGALIACRLIAVRVSKQVANERKAKVREKAHKNCRKASSEALFLAEWTIYVTNINAQLLKFDEALALARARWQIELLFKLWKSHGQIDQSRSRKPWRIMCEVYAKLIAMIIEHWLLITANWYLPDRSMFKAADTLRMFVMNIAAVFASKRNLVPVLAKIKDCIESGCRINKRKKRPANFQLLLAQPLA